MSTATAAVKASDAPYPAARQLPRVPTANAITIGTKTAETRSATRCGAFPVWASFINLAVLARAVSAPTWVATTTNSPPALTGGAGDLVTGADLDARQGSGSRLGAQNGDVLGTHLEQRFQGGSGPPLGARFEVALRLREAKRVLARIAAQGGHVERFGGPGSGHR
jgi:hypothetical protein